MASTHRVRVSKGKTGRPPRDRINAQEQQFAIYWVESGGRTKAAAIYAGFPPHRGVEIRRRRRVAAEIDRLLAKKQKLLPKITEAAEKAVEEKIAVTNEILDENFLYRLVHMETHERTGDLGIVKMFEVGYRRTGAIQPTRISVGAQAGVIAPGTPMKEVYKSKWLREKESQLSAELEQENDKQLPPSSQ